MAWLINALGALTSRLFTFFFGYLSFAISTRAALVTTYIIISATLFLGAAGAIKAAVMAIKVTAPPILANAAFFIPESINTLIASIITVRTAAAVYRWTQSNLAAFADVPNRKLLM